jgi:hypothetical protein
MVTYDVHTHKYCPVVANTHRRQSAMQKSLSGSLAVVTVTYFIERVRVYRSVYRATELAFGLDDDTRHHGGQSAENLTIGPGVRQILAL